MEHSIAPKLSGLDAPGNLFSAFIFAMIKHLSPDFKSLMPEILSRNTDMKVYQIQNGMEIEPGCIYLNPPKFTVTVSKRQLILKEQDPSYRINLPPSVLVNENGELVQICGDVDKYLKVPRGKVYYDIQKMVPKELSTALGTAISKVRKENKTVTYTNLKVKLVQEQIHINLIVKPLFTKKSGVLILVIFEEIKSSINLLSNAIKFTKEGGGIFVNIYDKGETVLISIKDSGVGIPKDKQDIIFDRFRQVDKSLTRNHEGSGIAIILQGSYIF